MKAIFGSLLCLVLTTSHCFAVKGGPVFGGGNVVTTGIYAGVLYPVQGANSIGLFSVQIPRTGLGTGTVFIFANQSAYNGTMQATADPDSAALTGFIDAGFNAVQAQCTANCSDPDTTKRTVTILNFRAVAAGRVDGQIKANTGSFRQASARLIGGSLVQFNPDFLNVGALFYDLVAFKQASL